MTPHACPESVDINVLFLYILKQFNNPLKKISGDRVENIYGTVLSEISTNFLELQLTQKGSLKKNYNVMRKKILPEIISMVSIPCHLTYLAEG